MATSNTVQIIDAVELTEGTRERYILEDDRILGRRAEVAEDSLDNLFAAPSTIAQGKKGKKAKPLTLEGTDGDDVLKGKKGNDKIYGKGGDDTLIGGKGNDFIVGGGESGTFDKMTGGKGKDVFSLVYQDGSVGYINDDSLDSGAENRGFAVITDFKLGEDKIQLSGFSAHYELVPVFWGQSFGSASAADTAIVYKGPEQDKFDVVGVISDKSLSSAYLDIPQSFTYVN